MRHLYEIHFILIEVTKNLHEFNYKLESELNRILSYAQDHQGKNIIRLTKRDIKYIGQETNSRRGIEFVQACSSWQINSTYLIEYHNFFWMSTSFDKCFIQLFKKMNH